MIGLGVRDVWEEPPKILVAESLKALIDCLAVYFPEVCIRTLKGPLHNHGNDDPFPVRGIKTGYSTVSLPQVLHCLHAW